MRDLMSRAAATEAIPCGVVARPERFEGSGAAAIE